MTKRIVNSHAGAVELLHRTAEGRFDAMVFEWFRDGARLYLSADGALDFGACVGLPSTPSKLRNAYRDLRLREAATIICKESPSAKRSAISDEVAAQMKQFVERGPWSQWCARPCPPVWARPLQEAFFFAVRFNGGKALSGRHVHTILGSK